MEKTNILFDLLTHITDGDFVENLQEELDNIEVDLQFERALEEEKIDVEYIKENAPWLQLPTETDNAYHVFKYYVNLPIDKWKVTDLALGLEEKFLQDLCDNNNWKARRLAYIKYKEWLRRRKDEVDNIDKITSYRDEQIGVLRSTTDAASKLIKKLGAKIEFINEEDIRVTDIPKFITAVETLVRLSSESEARVLAVSELLTLYENDLDIKELRQHIALETKTELKHGK